MLNVRKVKVLGVLFWRTLLWYDNSIIINRISMQKGMIIGVLAAALFGAGTSEVFAATMTPQLISGAPDGAPANGISRNPRISDDNRFVSFDSSASNLLANPTGVNPGMWNVFVYDRQTRVMQQVNIPMPGTQLDGDSYGSSISGDGRYVAFSSDSPNLVSGDTNGKRDDFVFDRQTNTTTRVSVASDGTQSNADSLAPTISQDGRYVIMYSQATNLDPAQLTPNGGMFVHDRQTRTTRYVDSSSDHTWDFIMQRDMSRSADGRYWSMGGVPSDTVTGCPSQGFFSPQITSNGQTRCAFSENAVAPTVEPYSVGISADGKVIVFLAMPVGGGAMSVYSAPNPFYTDTQQSSYPTAKFTIVVTTQGGDGTFTFGGKAAEYSVTTIGGVGSTTVTEFIVPPTEFTPSSGHFSISENIPDGWTLISSLCSSGEPSDFVLTAGSSVICTFVNAKATTSAATTSSGNSTVGSSAGVTSSHVPSSTIGFSESATSTNAQGAGIVASKGITPSVDTQQTISALLVKVRELLMQLITLMQQKR